MQAWLLWQPAKLETNSKRGQAAADWGGGGGRLSRWTVASVASNWQVVTGGASGCSLNSTGLAKPQGSGGGQA